MGIEMRRVQDGFERRYNEGKLASKIEAVWKKVQQAWQSLDNNGGNAENVILAATLGLDMIRDELQIRDPYRKHLDDVCHYTDIDKLTSELKKALSQTKKGKFLI